MSAPLPTEEDVLAFLVLNWALGALMIEDPDSVTPLRAAIDDWQEHEEYSMALEAAAHARLYDHDRIHAAAIADSERRLEVERARADVLGEARRHARVYRAFGDRADAIGQAVEDLERAEAEVSRHGG